MELPCGPRGSGCWIVGRTNRVWLAALTSLGAGAPSLAAFGRVIAALPPTLRYGVTSCAGH